MKFTLFQKILLCIAFVLCCYILVQVYIMRQRIHHFYKSQEGFGNVGITNMKFGSNANTDVSNVQIKASANSCYDSNGFIEIGDETNPKGLYNVIQTGTRFLDFEVYNVDGAGAIGYSGSSSFSSLETNTEKPIDVLNKIMDCAFTSPVPNPLDPIFLQFRMKTVKESIFLELANDINSVCGAKLTKTSVSSTNPKPTKINDLKSNIVIIIYSMYPASSSDGKQDVDRNKVVDKFLEKVPTALHVVANSNGNNKDFVNDYTLQSGTTTSPVDTSVKVKMPLIDDLINENGNLKIDEIRTVGNEDTIEKSYQKLIDESVNVIPYKFYIKDDHLNEYETKYQTSAFTVFS